jgi:DNA polymerase-3 subunit epsilon
MTAAHPQRLSDCLVLVFDTETTGVQVSSDRIVELGAVYLEHGRVQKPPYRMLVNPGVPIPPESSEVHGIRDSHVENAPTFAEVGRRFLTHLTGDARGGPPPVLAGYNAARFDTAIVNAEFARHGLDGHIDPARVVDPFVFMKWHHRNLRGRKLSDACAHYEVRLTNAHSAAADAVASGELLLRMVQAGRLPDDVEAALAAQRDFVRLIDEEMETWRHWIYRDREDGQTLRLGAGKPVGTPLDRVDAGWYRFVLETVQDLPEAARTEFARHVR